MSENEYKPVRNSSNQFKTSSDYPGYPFVNAPTKQDALIQSTNITGIISSAVPGRSKEIIILGKPKPIEIPGISGAAKFGAGILIISQLIFVLWREENSDLKSFLSLGEKLIDNKISENNKRLIFAQLNGLKRSYLELQSAVDYLQTVDSQEEKKKIYAIENVRKKFQFVYNIFVNRIAVFKSENNEIILLPIYAQVANLHLLLIRACIAYEDDWGLNQGTINNDYYAKQFKKYKKEYYEHCSYWADEAAKRYNNSKDKIDFERIIRVSVLDIMSLFESYDPRSPSTYLKDKGIIPKLELTREIYTLSDNYKDTKLDDKHISLLNYNNSNLNTDDVYVNLTREPHLFTWLNGFNFYHHDNGIFQGTHMVYNKVRYSYTCVDEMKISDVYGHNEEKELNEITFKLQNGENIHRLYVNSYNDEAISAINSIGIESKSSRGINKRNLFNSNTTRKLSGKAHYLPFMEYGENQYAPSHILSYMKTYYKQDDYKIKKNSRISAFAWTHTSVDPKNTIIKDRITEIPAVKACRFGKGRSDVLEDMNVLSYTGENLVKFCKSGFLDMYLNFKSNEVDYYMRLNYAANTDAPIMLSLEDTTINRKKITLKKTYSHNNDQNLKPSDFDYSETIYFNLKHARQHLFNIYCMDNPFILNKIEFIPVKVEDWQVPMKRALEEFTKSYPINGTYIGHSEDFSHVTIENFSVEKYGAQIITDYEVKRIYSELSLKDSVNNNFIPYISESHSNCIENWTTYGFKFNKEARPNFELPLVLDENNINLSNICNFSGTSIQKNTEEYTYESPWTDISEYPYEEVNIDLNIVKAIGSVNLLTKMSGDFVTNIRYQDSRGNENFITVQDNIRKLATHETRPYLVANSDGRTVNLIGDGAYEATYGTDFTVNLTPSQNEILFKGWDENELLASVYIKSNKLYVRSNDLRAPYDDKYPETYFSVRLLRRDDTRPDLFAKVECGADTNSFERILNSVDFDDGDILEVYHKEPEKLEISHNYKKLITSEKNTKTLYLTKDNIIKTGLRFKGVNDNLIADLYIDSNTLYVNSTGIIAHNGFNNRGYFSVKLLNKYREVKVNAIVQGHETADKFAEILNGVSFEVGDILDIYHAEHENKLEIINDYIKTNKTEYLNGSTYNMYLIKKGIRFKNYSDELVAELYVDPKSNKLKVNSTGKKAFNTISVEVYDRENTEIKSTEIESRETADEFAEILNDLNLENVSNLTLANSESDKAEVIDNYKKTSVFGFMEKIYFEKNSIKFKGLGDELIADLYIDSNILYVNSTGVQANSKFGNTAYFSVKLLSNDRSVKFKSLVQGNDTANNFAEILNGIHFEDGDILDIYHAEADPEESRKSRLEIICDYNKLEDLEGKNRRIYLTDSENISNKGYSFGVTPKISKKNKKK